MESQRPIKKRIAGRFVNIFCINSLCTGSRKTFEFLWSGVHEKLIKSCIKRMDGRKNFQSGRCSKCISKSTICRRGCRNGFVNVLSEFKYNKEEIMKYSISVPRKKKSTINKITDTLNLNLFLFCITIILCNCYNIVIITNIIINRES